MEKRIRNSNMELLRILAMLMIVIYHISFHAVRSQLVDIEYISKFSNSFFCTPHFFKRLFLIEAVMPFGIVANAFFFLISGYFMVEKGKNIDLGKISKKLLLQVSYAAIVLTVISAVYYRYNAPDNATNISLRVITDFNSMNWFVGYYFLVIAFAGCFFNGFIENMDQTVYCSMLLTVFAMFSFSWSGGVLEGLGGFRVLFCGAFLYALGGYIKRYNPFEKVRTWVLIFTLLLIYAFIYLSYYNVFFNSAHDYQMRVAIAEISGESVGMFIQPLVLFENYSAIPLVISVIIFELFRRVKISNIRIINRIGSGTFMIYLIHDNEFWRCIWREHDWIKILAQNKLLYFEKIFLNAGIVFFVGLVAYGIFEWLCNVFIRFKNIAIRKD